MDVDPVLVDAATQADIISCLSQKLRDCYVFPDMAERICGHLQAYLMSGEYKELTDGNLFALGLTLHMQEVSQDEHLWVRWHAEALPDEAGQLRLNPAWQEQQQLQARRENYGFYKLERLPGNVGYLDIHLFHRAAWGADTAASAMSFLSNTDVLIFDLRQCTGGYPDMLTLLCSYLFPGPALHLASIYWRDDHCTDQFWTHSSLSSSSFGEKPVFVLTSGLTFSAGELFANILQSRKRATVVGEKTDGGANPGASYRIHPHVEAFIPIGYTIDPRTGTKWENFGVTPDICVTAEQSFNTAYQLALQSLGSGVQGVVSLIGVDFTRDSRSVFTRHDRPVFTRRDRPMFTTHRRPVFTTVAESLPRPQWERNTGHGADPHEHLYRNHIPIASYGK